MKSLLLPLLACLSLNTLQAAELEKATVAAGCFWCVEAIYEQVPGVTDAVSGFSGGKMSQPTYRSHGDHTETVEITFDPDQVSYEALIRIFWNSHDVTDARGVAPDFGRSYRPALFYRSPEQLATIKRVKTELQTEHKKPIATEIVAYEQFWPAEAYHQNFVKRNPKHPYVKNVSLPRVNETLDK